MSKEEAAEWKAHLEAKGYRPATINSMLSAPNKFFLYSDCPEYRVRYLRIQRRIFRGEKQELNQKEYVRLLETA